MKKNKHTRAHDKQGAILLDKILRIYGPTHFSPPIEQQLIEWQKARSKKEQAHAR